MPCECPNKYPGKECAHYLSNFMIDKQKVLEKFPLPKERCCPEGRPINAL